MVTSTPRRHVRVAIAGSGFAGLGAAIRLKQAGIDDFVVLERAHDVGGVWRDNVYPGCACDVQSRLYSFSFATSARWTREYAPQAEILAYLKDCAERFGVLAHVRFDHAVQDAAWDEQCCLWRIRTSQGTITADAFVAAVGALSEPAVPDLPGLSSFQGKAMHSARWDHGFDLRGKRVAVVGTGASAIQIVPAIQPSVGRLTVFQRTPPWILPRNDRALSSIERALLEAVPPLRRLARDVVHHARELYVLGFKNPALMPVLRAAALLHLRRSVPDRALREKLTPRYEIGCKRILLSDDYLSSLTRPNVEVVASPVAEVRARSVVDGEGVEREVDAIVLCTGFQVTDPPIARSVRGLYGKTLADVWQGSPQAHLGTTIAGFPSFFLLQGPNSGLGHSSVIAMIEAQIEHVVLALKHVERRGVAALHPRREAQARFVAEVERGMKGSVWTAGGCKSWYLDKTGRNSTIWPGTIASFRRRVARFDASDYVEIPRAEPGVRSLSDRLEHEAARLLLSLPPRVQLKLSGGAPVVVEDEPLHPELQLLLALRALRRAPPLGGGCPARARARFRRESLVHAGPTVPVGAVADLTLDVEPVPLRARHYAPPSSGEGGAAKPLLVFLHGGGFVLGDLDTHDPLCRTLCRHADVHVLSIEYRLAPEAPWPAAVDDALAAYRWALSHARALGADPARVAVGGDSAGGHLAALVAQIARAEGRPPALQLLLYPAIDRQVEHPSLSAYADGFLLTTADVRWFHAQYTGGASAQAGDPRASPLSCEDLGRSPPALVVTAGFDPLRDEGEAFARALQQAGARAKLRRYGSMLHGFASMVGLSGACREAVVEIAGDVRAMLSSAEGADA